MEDSYADIATKLAAKVNKWNTRLEGAQDSIAKGTAQRMLERSERRVADLESAFMTDFTANALEKLGAGSSGEGSMPKAAKGASLDNPFKGDPVQAGTFALNAMLSLMDNNKNKNAINSMQAPAEPLKYSSPRLNTTVDVSGQEGSLRDSIAGFRDNARRTHGSAGSRTAATLKALDAQSRGMNQIYSAKANQEGQLRNQQALLDKRTNTQNVATQNQYLQSLVDFNNNKIGAQSQNYANSINDLMLISTDYGRQAADKKRFNTMIPLWDKDGVYSSYYGR